ncbi:dephospho-CoA kinase [Hydrogenimonas cancrithermarum]|uniref:Dephospho-CoA kinase n=1 Tax=Hydrogenimonas cancrithermarum TaxID=2993563 RepID=A0ABN6WWA5_9BACT|nr:dephospho-CoA kinase [Hydrogenimonas cancrithermarum]BDY13153.1 dephospho-CoA kinase [Hydrogenimonas cancrithermarum]
MAFKHAVALTGGIASGKSTACNLLKLYGLRIIDADAIARQILDDEADAVAELFGDEYVADGKVDRKRLGQLIFSDKEARKQLEVLLHPKIREEIVRQSEVQDRLGGPYIVDIPLFFETGSYPIEKVIVVYAPRETQKKRLIEREGLGEEEAEARLNAQIDIEEKRKKATWVIDNSQNLKHLQRETERIFNQITNSR